MPVAGGALAVEGATAAVLGGATGAVIFGAVTLEAGAVGATALGAGAAGGAVATTGATGLGATPSCRGNDAPPGALLGAPVLHFAFQQNRIFRFIDGIAQCFQIVPGRFLLRRLAVGYVEDLHALVARESYEF